MTYSNVLFVDDNFWCHLNNCDYLRDQGLTVIEAYTASEACDAIGGDLKLTALITDIELGTDIDGFEIARRGRASCPTLPVVYISGTASARHRAEGVARSEFVSKPCEPHEIWEALDRAICNEAA